jgi:hypothetical protein
MALTYLWFLSLWTFKGKKYEKGPISPPHDFILKKSGLRNCLWLLDKKLQLVWLFNYQKTIINFVIILLH